MQRDRFHEFDRSERQQSHVKSSTSQQMSPLFPIPIRTVHQSGNRLRGLHHPSPHRCQPRSDSDINVCDQPLSVVGSPCTTRTLAIRKICIRRDPKRESATKSGRRRGRARGSAHALAVQSGCPHEGREEQYDPSEHLLAFLDDTYILVEYTFFHPKTISSTDTFIQKRFHPMTLSSKRIFIH